MNQSPRRNMIALASVAAVLTAAPAKAEDAQGAVTFQVRATVPMACWVKPADAVVAGDGAAGTVVEACNSAGGFSVWASYRPLQFNESATLSYDGHQVELSKAGQQLLRHSASAAIRTVSFSFGKVELAAPLVLALTIQPI